MQPPHMHSVTAPAGGLVSGQPFQAAETGSLALIYQGLRSAAAGDTVIGVSAGTFELAALSTLVSALDASVHWVAGNSQVEASGGFAVGKIRRVKSSGQAVAVVQLNA